MKYDTKALEAKMKKTISAYETNLETIRAGQANPAVLNRVTFEYYGAPTPLNTMANVMVTDARTLTIQPYDRSTLKAMEKAILASDVGITPLNDGTVLRLVFPQLTEERRRDLTKQVKKMGEDAKVALRNERRNANEEVKKAKKDEIDRKVREIARKVDLSDEQLKKAVSQLSGGQQQRVAIARALALQPDILCFDEPTSALDPELTGEVLKVIRSLSEQHMTMIIVTHEMAFARDVAGRVIFMDGGVIVEQGPARDVIENPQAERTRQFLARYRENQ